MVNEKLVYLYSRKCVVFDRVASSLKPCQSRVEISHSDQIRSYPLSELSELSIQGVE